GTRRLHFRAFNSCNFIRVFFPSALALLSQPPQQRKTGCPWIMTLTGVPMTPSRFVSLTAQNFWASANRRSSGLSPARDFWISASASDRAGAGGAAGALDSVLRGWRAGAKRLADRKLSTWASVASGRARASFSQPLQHRNTGLPLRSTLTGVPISPRRLSGKIGQNSWASTRLRSAGRSLA